MLRPLAQGQAVVEVPGSTLRDVLAALEVRFPGIRQRLCDGDTLRPDVSVVVDAQLSALGMRQAVQPDSEIHFVPAIGGG
jgi:molybdopterin synthase sulfur carrier subunit